MLLADMLEKMELVDTIDGVSAGGVHSGGRCGRKRRHRHAAQSQKHRAGAWQ